MSGKSATKLLYNAVMQDVYEKMRLAVEREGLDESVVDQIHELWKKNLDDSQALKESMTPQGLTQTAGGGSVVVPSHHVMPTTGTAVLSAASTSCRAVGISGAGAASSSNDEYHLPPDVESYTFVDEPEPIVDGSPAPYMAPPGR
mmetsp:Transcript_13094/g.22422  ORF Transcript_13094/g.22422 Transcript_13094/m.22422 type:complete len:145 (-) Transcript_13094:322-756(-)